MSREIADFDYFVDREKNKPCLVAGNGPTIKDFPYKNFRGIYVLMGSGPQILRGLVRPDYWVNANFYFPVPQRHLKAINSFRESVFVFSDSAVYARKNVYDHEFLKNNLSVSWFAFDERHFNGKKCDPVQPCCRLTDLYPGRLTIQEYLERRFNRHNVYRAVGTAVLHSLAFALLMGCSPIYLQGIELPLRAKDYTYFRLGNLMDARLTLRAYKARLIEAVTGNPRPSDFHADIDQTLAGFERLIEIGHSTGKDIFNLSRTSTLNRIKTLPYKSADEV